MRLCLLLCLALIFAGCTSNASVQPTLRGPVVPTRVIPPTPTASDTPTETPTETPSATNTPEPTSTDTLPPPTDTPSATNTPEPTSTDTLPPPTETPSATNTPEPTSTDTLPPPTETPSPTDTPEPTPALAETPVEFEPILYRNSTSLFPIYIGAPILLDNIFYQTLGDDTPTILFSFEATTGMTIDISMTAQERGNLDPFLLVLDPKGREIARNDDIDKEHHDSQIRGLTIPANGTYVIVATRYAQVFGETEGDFGLLVSLSAPGTAPTGSFSQATGYDALTTGVLNDDTPEQLYTFRATAGDVVSIQMTNTSGDLDPKLTLTNNIGTPLVSNDDNLLTGMLDSAIQGYIIPRSGYYTLIAGRYSVSSNSGNYRLKIALDSQNAVGVEAILDPINSTTVTDEDKKLGGYTLGDQLDESSREHTLQVLLTFLLPPNDEMHPIYDAQFELLPCQEYGGGFDTLGSMTIYQDNYGRVSQARNLTHPLPGARILNAQASCDALDLTDLVQAAYENGNPSIQLRLMLRNHADNGEDDQVQFTPSLRIEFGQ